MKKGLIGVLLLASPVMATDQVYTVEKGDTLSKITKAKLGTPIYGNQGNLNKLLKANVEVTNPDLILIDQKITIPFAKETKPDEVNLQLAATLKNKLSGNLSNTRKEKSKWDFSLDAKAFVTTIGIQARTNNQLESAYSGLSYGGTANVYYEGTDWFQGRLELGVDKVNYENDNITITQDNSALSSAILGAEFLYDNEILIGLYSGLKERLVITGLDQNSLTIKRQAIGQVGLGTAFMLSEFGKNKMALGLNGNLLLENSGREFGAEVSIIRSRLTFTPFLNYTTMKNSLGQQDDLGTGLNLSYQF